MNNKWNKPNRFEIDDGGNVIAAIFFINGIVLLAGICALVSTWGGA